jgi:hypothetical protein
LFAIPFDLEKLETHGSAVPVLDDVAYQSPSGTGQFDVSRTGTLIYRRASGGASGTATLQWVDPSGQKEPLQAKPGVYRFPSLSPDGKRVALTVAEGGQDVWVYDSKRDAMTRLTFGGFNISPRWSPDGQSVVFSSAGNGIFQTRADGASQPHALMQSKSLQNPGSFTPDGKRLAYLEVARNIQILDGAVGGRGRPGESRDAGAMAQEQLRRRQPCVLARWSMAGLSIERIGEK